MRLLIATLSILVAVSSAAGAAALQVKGSTQADAQAQSKAGVNAQPESLMLEQGSELQADLKSSLNLKKAKKGDSFKMVTTRAVKQNGKTVLNKGSLISGHIEEVTRSKSDTRAILAFDQVRDAKTGLTASLSAAIVGVTQTANRRAEREMPAPSGRSSSTPPPPRQSSGGLIGGAVDTVAGAAGQVTTTVESTTRATTGAGVDAGRSVGALSGGALRVVTDTTAQTTAGSAIALTGPGTTIETGTSFVLKTTSNVVLQPQQMEKKSASN